jgi:hypothetical protein
MFVTVIRVFKEFLFSVQAECTKFTRVYDSFQSKVYLFIIYLFNIYLFNRILPAFCYDASDFI